MTSETIPPEPATLDLTWDELSEVSAALGWSPDPAIIYMAGKLRGPSGAIAEMTGMLAHVRAGTRPPAVLLARAADRRWRRETGGIVVDGIPIATDDRSKQMLLGARMAAAATPDFTTRWVASDGSVHDLDAAAIVAVSDAVLAHVSGCFAIYASVSAGIQDGSVTTLSQVDEAFGLA